MSKNEEKTIISKQLARDLIWWLEHASAPCMTIGEVHERWYQLFSDPQLTLARDSMKDELGKALVANVEVAYEPVNHVTNVGKKVVLTVDEAKEIAAQLKRNAELFFIQTDEFDYDTEDLHRCLLEKIEQAEGKE